MQLYYFDDPENGLARETSHPFFIKHATLEFYYDGGDDFSPFGSDTGHDLLRELEEWYQERKANAKAATWLRQLIETWGFNTDYLNYKTQVELAAIDLNEQYLNDVLDKAIIATVFGQYKIAGKADKAMHKLVAAAFMRQRYMTNIAKSRNNPWDLADDYLARLVIMENDLAFMANKKAR